MGSIFYKKFKNEFLTRFLPILDFIFCLALLDCQHQFELNAQICATYRLLHSLATQFQSTDIQEYLYLLEIEHF